MKPPAGCEAARSPAVGFRGGSRRFRGVETVGMGRQRLVLTLCASLCGEEEALPAGPRVHGRCPQAQPGPRQPGPLGGEVRVTAATGAGRPQGAGQLNSAGAGRSQPVPALQRVIF